MGALERLGLAQVAQGGADASAPQAQTSHAFGFKWARRDTYESPAMQQMARQWLFERYCAGDPARLDAWLEGGRKLILDAGCGAAHSALLFFGERLRAHDYLGVDISEAAWVARDRFREAGHPGDFLQWDLTRLPLPDACVDLIFSEGVLHHTDDTGAAVCALARLLRPGGRFLFYVYAKKGPVREFTDDHVRAALAPLSDEQAWEATLPLTRLGIALGKLAVELEVPEDVPALGIRAGKIDLQRFFYQYVCKAFYRPDLDEQEMNHINFDWFRPSNCHRHTEAEVRGFCAAGGLVIEHLDAQVSGYTVVARKAGP